MASFDHAARPEVDRCAITAMDKIQAAELVFSTHPAVVWLGMTMRKSVPADVADVFCQVLGVRPSDIQVAPHYPEDFIVYFVDPKQWDDAAGQNIKFGGRSFNIHA